MIRQAKPFVIFFLLAIPFLGHRSGWAQTIDTEKATKVKWAYVLNFAKFTTWPDGTFTDNDSPLVICVWGRQALDRSLQQVVEGKMIDRRKVLISRINDHAPDPASDTENDPPDHTVGLSENTLAKLHSCHLLFIGETETDRMKVILKILEPLKILTVSDIPRFAEQGGMLGLVLRRGRITFEANPVTIKKAGIKVSSKILKLATIVRSNRD